MGVEVTDFLTGAVGGRQRWFCLCAAILFAIAGHASATGGPATAEAETRQDGVVDMVIARIDAGHFKAAELQIGQALADPQLATGTRDALRFQRERMRRILLDFTLSRDDVKARLRTQIPDLSDAEFAQWDETGLLEHMDIDGKRLYFNRAPSNLFRISAQARARRSEQSPFTASPLESAHPHHSQVVAQARAQDSTSVSSHRIRVTQTLKVDADAVPAGETVRAWIPYPRAIAGQQESIRYVSSKPSVHEIAPESVLQRTVYLEQPARAGQATEFSVSYDVTISARYFAIDPDAVISPEITPELLPFVSERAPHVEFTDAIRAYSKQIVGDETNAYRIAQKLFAAVDRTPWAGAREYSTISNIGDYALHAGHADCGQQTLLLITLLRLNGIPARWQSGMMFADNGYWNLHDWGQLYLAPYGWVPMDVTFGRLESPDPAVAGFYLGGLDAWRIAFNDDYSRDFVPAKQHFRSETVDLQRGEAEWRGGNLYFDQWDYAFTATLAVQEVQ